MLMYSTLTKTIVLASEIGHVILFNVKRLGKEKNKSNEDAPVY
jgi:hypothetical protein